MNSGIVPAAGVSNVRQVTMARHSKSGRYITGLKTALLMVAGTSA